MRGTAPPGSRLSKPWQPKAYQRKALKFMLGQGAAGLFLDPGLGKTSISLAAVSFLLLKRWNKAALVIAPLRPCYSVWPAEVLKWKDFNHLRVQVLHGAGKLAALHTPADVYVINPEGLAWLFQMLRLRKEWPFDVLVVDESSKFRHSNTQRFKNLRSHLRRFMRRYILTGTPTPNGLLNLWGQIYILDQGHALGAYFTHYRNTYFDAGGYGGYTFTPKPDAEKRILAKLRPLVLRMSAEDYLELPPLTKANIYVELPPAARRVYDQVEKQFFAELDKDTVTAANAAVVGGKCRQIANGGVYVDALERRAKHLHAAKSEALVDLLDELEGQPALVAYEYKHDLERIKAALKKGGYGHVPHIGGGVSAAEGRRLETEWNAGRLPVLLGHPASVAFGLNLQERGRAVIWHSLTWDLELYMQYIQRVWRQGQRQPVFVYHLIARGTVDEAVLGGLAQKDKTQGGFLKALRSYRRRAAVEGS